VVQIRDPHSAMAKMPKSIALTVNIHEADALVYLGQIPTVPSLVYRTIAVLIGQLWVHVGTSAAAASCRTIDARKADRLGATVTESGAQATSGQNELESGRVLRHPPPEPMRC
jgi:hypothetical protein